MSPCAKSLSAECLRPAMTLCVRSKLLCSDNCNWSGAHTLLCPHWQHYSKGSWVISDLFTHKTVQSWVRVLCSGAVANAHLVYQTTGTSQGEQRRPALSLAVEEVMCCSKPQSHPSLVRSCWFPESHLLFRYQLGLRGALVFSMFVVQRNQRSFFAVGWFPSYT